MTAFQLMLIFYSNDTFEFQCLLVTRKIGYIFGFHSFIVLPSIQYQEYFKHT